MRAGFAAAKNDAAGINACFDGLESKLRYRYEQLDRIDDHTGEIDGRLRRVEAFLRSRLNGGTPAD
jgi:hypothetical protein